ncbi:MAG TPA: DUF72 domain-containing protein [Gammaproteobacteria bacterium]|nr:DUF72 domain-containing protein [Gammaproteobacteria bacterium]
MALTMKLLAGTSGFSYTEWKGPFYPSKLPAKDMLRYYSSRLPAVEINNTFYRLPSASTLQEWRSQVPDTFRFAIKAARKITHLKRLADCDGELRYLLEIVTQLHPCLGSILFQLPPFLRKDLPLLSAFIAQLPDKLRAAFEFRHDSWFDESVFELLSARNLALVLSESDDSSAADLPWTADWAYLRLRKSEYADSELDAWLARLRTAGLDEAQVFFKHEDEAVGPRMAEAFLSRYSGASTS